MNSKYIAKFEKVSFEQYLKDRMAIEGVTTEDPAFESDYMPKIFETWKNIKLPMRGTTGAAGYDFYSPDTYAISEHSVLFPTGIRVKMDDEWVLMLFPRSGLGTKYGCALDNTTGIIDSDYYYANNEGHIMAKLHSTKAFLIEKGDRFMQGIFVPFGVAENGNNDAQRTGGFGSTGTK